MVGTAAVMSMVRFLAEPIRSIADGEGEKAMNRLVVVSADASPGLEARVQNHLKSQILARRQG